jgi:indolepyruvate ferredoxin oxidoreductase alpha subunit
VAPGEDDPRKVTRPAPERRPPDRKTEKYCLLPRFSRPLHRSLLERVERLRQFAEASAAAGDLARVEPAAGPVPLQGGGTQRVGVVSAGAAYCSAREALPGAAFLKLGMIHPLPVEAIRAFAATVDRLFVVEELEPYLEEQILAAGIACEGKEWFPQWGELTAVRVGRGFYAAGLDLPRWAEEKAAEDDSVIPRPPVLCTGCPHRGMATAMKKLNLDVHGDIGCYDLTTLPPVSHMHSAVEMGASVPMEQGFSRAGGSETGSIAVIGDSTFLHSGLTGLLNAVHQRTDMTLLIQDNRITAMTGGQTNPGNERTLAGVETKPVDIAGICRALGVEHVVTVDPYDYQACLSALKAGLAFGGPAVIITNRPCMLFPSKLTGEAFTVDEDVCNACQQCMKLGCPSLLHVEAEHKGRHKVRIDEETCTGCSLCEQLCKPGAISKAKAGVA